MVTFSTEIISAVLTHMNTDHREDNVVIARANGVPEVTDSVMTGLDSEAGVWSVTVDGTERELRIAWAQTVAERADIRKQVTIMYRNACATLGVKPRLH